MNDVIARNEEQAVANRPEVQTAGSPMRLIEMAVQSDAPIEKLEKLMDLQERWERNEAKKAFDHAMAGFRSESIRIVKNKTASFGHRDGSGETSYQFADLGTIVNAVVPALSKHGLSHHWETDQKDARIYVTCTITHESGHSRSTTLNASPDDSGKKNAIQSIGSTIAYLQRYTFLAAVGLATEGQDDDGHAAGGPSATLIDEEQIGALTKLLKETGSDKAAFLDWLGQYDGLEDIRERDYERAILQLRRKELRQAQEAQEAKEGTDADS